MKVLTPLSPLPLDNENQADLYSHSPNLSTSVFNNQQSKVLSIKSNQLYNSNLQTAQKRDLENIFNTNALANYDIEIGNINPSKNYNLVTLSHLT
jgi:predicted component of type VI protein secretion system